MRELAFVLLLVMIGCVPNATRKTTEGLRTREGVCSQSQVDLFLRFTTCMRQGSPQSLHDDPATSMLLIEVVNVSLDSARPDGYQLTVLHDGVQVYQETLPDGGIPRPNGNVWTGGAVVFMPFVWSPGVWQFRYVSISDTSVVGASSATITMPGAKAAVGAKPAVASRPGRM